MEFASTSETAADHLPRLIRPNGDTNPTVVAALERQENRVR